MPAELGLLLRDSPGKADAAYENVLENAKKAKGSDSEGYRAEFIKLVETVKELVKAGQKPAKDT